MNKALVVAIAMVAFVGCRSTCDVHVPESDAQPVATTPAPAESLELNPTGLLVSLGGQGSEIQPLQMPVPGRGTLPEGFKFDLPLDLGGPMPKDEDVRAAIASAVSFLLDSQKENGAWDVDLTGTLLSDTADDAVDAIAATGLAGIALRYHVNVDVERIQPALRKAAEFVIDRVYRGKLPLKVWYANWRYTLGLKFLYGEYGATTDEEFRNNIVAVCRRMVNSMMRLQRLNGDAPLLEKKRRARLTQRARRNAAPSTLGLILAAPTDTDYRGGALVERVYPGSQAEAAGIKPGMRIVKAEGLTVENALDYYMLECGWIGEQTVRIHVKDTNGATDLKTIKLKQLWPGYVGIKLGPSIGEGPIIEDFLAFSPARKSLQVGDVITELNGKSTATAEDVAQIVAEELKPGDTAKFKILRTDRKGKKKKDSANVKTGPSPEGTFWLAPEDEDKGDEGGIVVEEITRDGCPAEQAGIQKGDRIIRIGDTPIIGYDHYGEFLGTVPAGTTQKVQWLRAGQEMEAEIVASPTPQPWDLTFQPIPNPIIGQGWEAFVRTVASGGPAAKAGLRPGDIILSVNGVITPDFWDFVIELLGIGAGEILKLSVKRGDKEHEVAYELPKLDLENEKESETIEEGGWYYYPQYSAPTFATASAMLVLNDVNENMKEIKVPRESLKAAINYMHSLRIVDKDNGNTETYVYSPDGRDAEQARAMGFQDIRGCQGRNCICELAMFRLRARSKANLKRMVEAFIKHRGELDYVRRMEYYVSNKWRRGSPHCLDRYANAAYYWLYGHYHALLAAKEVGGKTHDKVNDICVKALMATRHADGLWTGHPSFGKLCGTCEALWILGETEGNWRVTPPTVDDKPGPITQPDKGEPKEEGEEKKPKDTGVPDGALD